MINYLKKQAAQSSTWGGLITLGLTAAVATGDAATGGAVTTLLTAAGAIMGAVETLRDENKGKEQVSQ